MNAPLNLDDLKQRWAAQDPLLERSLRLNVALMRENLAGKAAASLAPQKRVKWFELLCHAIVAAWLSGFALQHLSELRYAIPGFLVALFYIGVVAVDVRQRRLLDRLDFSAPIGAVQAQIGALRGFRLRIAKWILLIAPLLWLPFPAILFKSLFDVDFYAGVGTLYWSVSLAFALAWIPLMLLVLQLCARRFAQSRGLQALLDGLAGPGMASTRRFGDLLAEFDATQASDLPASVRAALAQPVAATESASTARVEAVRSIVPQQATRLLVGILMLASSLLGTGSLMAAHGGTAAFLVPTLILHLCLVATMIALIRLRMRVLGLDVDGSAETLRGRVIECMNARVQLARILLTLAPAAALALLLLILQLTGSVSTATTIGADAWVGFGLAIVAGCTVALWIAPRMFTRFDDAPASTLRCWIQGRAWLRVLHLIDAPADD